MPLPLRLISSRIKPLVMTCLVPNHPPFLVLQAIRPPTKEN